MGFLERERYGKYASPRPQGGWIVSAFEVFLRYNPKITDERYGEAMAETSRKTPLARFGWRRSAGLIFTVLHRLLRETDTFCEGACKSPDFAWTGDLNLCAHGPQRRPVPGSGGVSRPASAVTPVGRPIVGRSVGHSRSCAAVASAVAPFRTAVAFPGPHRQRSRSGHRSSARRPLSNLCGHRLRSRPFPDCGGVRRPPSAVVPVDIESAADPSAAIEPLCGSPRRSPCFWLRCARSPVRSGRTPVGDTLLGGPSVGRSEPICAAPIAVAPFRRAGSASAVVPVGAPILNCVARAVRPFPALRRRVPLRIGRGPG
jgi:hypothetical protein